MLIGKVGCGKTTLCQRIFNEDIKYKKTQTVEVIGGSAIDTPGEYMEHRQFYKALVITAVEADLILFLHAADDDQFVFSPRMTTMFNRPAIGVITKTDLVDGLDGYKGVHTALEYAGLEKIFAVSATSNENIKELIDYINADEE